MNAKEDLPPYLDPEAAALLRDLDAWHDARFARLRERIKALDKGDTLAEKCVDLEVRACKAEAEVARLRERIGALAEDMECPPWYRTKGHAAACHGCSKAIRVRALIEEGVAQ